MGSHSLFYATTVDLGLISLNNADWISDDDERKSSLGYTLCIRRRNNRGAAKSNLYDTMES